MKIDENTTPLLTVDHLKQYFKAVSYTHLTLPTT